MENKIFFVGANFYETAFHIEQGYDGTGYNAYTQ